MPQIEKLPLRHCNSYLSPAKHAVRLRSLIYSSRWVWMQRPQNSIFKGKVDMLC